MKKFKPCIDLILKVSKDRTASSGATLVEYALMLILISLISIGTVNATTATLTGKFGSASKGLNSSNSGLQIHSGGVIAGISFPAN